MAYLDIVFHNLRQGGQAIVGKNDSPNLYLDFPQSVRHFYDTPYIRDHIPLVTANIWKDDDNICGNNHACAVFFCESGPYPGLQDRPTFFDNSWCNLLPSLDDKEFRDSLYPYPPNDNLHFCAYFNGGRDSSSGISRLQRQPVPGFDPIFFPIRTSDSTVLYGMGTGQIMAAEDSNRRPLPGSDRYGIIFKVATRTYPDSDSTPIKGLFVHVKNTDADPGTQIAALCRQFQDYIIFGDLNLDIRKVLKRQSLEAAISETHVLKYHVDQLLHSEWPPYFTHYKKGNSNRSNGKSTLDYALVPKPIAGYVSISGLPHLGPVPKLETFGSDHAVMMMRIQCQ